MIAQIYTRRLQDTYWPRWCHRIFQDRRLEHIKPEPTYQAGGRDHRYDLRRVRYFIDALRRGVAIDPITIESWGTPVITDGHHRFIAHYYHGAAYITATLACDVRHAEWLCGHRDDLIDLDLVTA